MHVALIRLDSPASARVGRGPAAVAGLFRIAVVALALVAAGPVARADGDGTEITSEKPSINFFELASRRTVAAQRIEELEQGAWKLLAADGDFAAATASISRAAELARSEFGEEHWLTKLKGSVAAGARSLAASPPERIQLFVDAVKGQALSTTLHSRGNDEGALVELKQAREKLQDAVGADHILSAYALLGIASNEFQMNDFGSAARDVATAKAVLKTAWGEKNPGYGHVIFYQAITEAGLRELESAEQHYREALEILEPVVREGVCGQYFVQYAGVQLRLARLLNDQERFADAEPFARHGSEILGFAARQMYSDYRDGQLVLACSLSGQGKNAEAEILFNCLIKSVQPNPPPHVIGPILLQYANHLHRADRHADAYEVQAFLLKICAQSIDRVSKRKPETGSAPLADIPGANKK